MLNTQIQDLDRVEILKGPQGTLYGRNSTAGAINFISAPPVQRHEGRLRVGYGNYDTFSAEAMVNQPLGDSAALRLSGRITEQDDGYWKSRLLPGTLGRQSIQTGRAMLALEPLPSIQTLIKGEVYRQRGQLGVAEFFGAIDPATFMPCASILAGRSDDVSCTNFFGYTDADRDPFIVDTERKGFLRNDGWDLTMRNHIDLSAATLTAITGYRRFKQAIDTNIDSTPLPILDFISSGRVKAFSQELRLQGTAGALDWLVGAFYSWDNFEGQSLGDNQALFNTNLLITADQTTKSAAGFTHLIYALTSTLEAVGGLRYTWERRTYAGGSFDLNPFAGSVLCGGCAIANIPLAVVDDRITDNNLTGNIGLNFRPSNDTLIYGLIARGQKSGGFYFGLATAVEQLAPYRPEKLTSYEVGVKADVADGLAQLNLSAFYYDYKNIQTFIRSNAGAIPIQILGNVPKARVKGIDADLSLKPIDGLTLQAAIGLLDTRLGAYTTGSGLVVTGNDLPNAPKFSFRGAATYEMPMQRWGRLRFSVQPSYSSSQFRDADNNPLLGTKAYWLVDAQVGADFAGGWSATLWGRNLTNEQYVTQAIDLTSLGFGNKNYNAPRTYGLTIGFEW